MAALQKRAGVGVYYIADYTIRRGGVRNNQEVISRFLGRSGLILPHNDGKMPNKNNELIAEIGDFLHKYPDKADALAAHIRALMRDFNKAALPEKPLREYRPRESIIEYLRSDEGFGPWLTAGTLTRPLLRELSPKAYTALSNWLRNNELPADIRVPKKSDLVDAKLSDPETVKEARRIRSALQRRGLSL